jgi:hypothetical protein
MPFLLFGDWDISTTEELETSNLSRGEIDEDGISCSIHLENPEARRGIRKKSSMTPVRAVEPFLDIFSVKTDVRGGLLKKAAKSPVQPGVEESKVPLGLGRVHPFHVVAISN